jgi:hypothetical protein
LGWLFFQLASYIAFKINIWIFTDTFRIGTTRNFTVITNDSFTAISPPLSIIAAQALCFSQPYASMLAVIRSADDLRVIGAALDARGVYSGVLIGNNIR